MTGCCAVGCRNRPDKKNPGVTFHRFPKDSVLRAAWIVACRRKNWLPSAFSNLCNEHFSEDLIDRSFSKVRLRENAIPNIFKDPTENPHRRKIPWICEPSVQQTVFFIKKESQSGDESASQTTEEYGMKETELDLDSPKYESSDEHEVPVSTPEKSTSPEKHAAFKAEINFLSEVDESSDESTPNTPTKCDVIKPTVCSNSSVNDVDKRPLMQKIEVCKSPKKRLLPTATRKSPKKRLLPTATTPIFNEVIHSSVKIVSKDPTKCSEIENKPLVQIPKKFTLPNHVNHVFSAEAKALEKNFLSTTAKAVERHQNVSADTMAISDNEENDENGSEMSMEDDGDSMNPTDYLEISEEESDSELYPKNDIEKKYLKRKLILAKFWITKYRKKIKILQQQNRRWKKRFENAQRTINVLQKTNESLLL